MIVKDSDPILSFGTFKPQKLAQTLLPHYFGFYISVIIDW